MQGVLGRLVWRGSIPVMGFNLCNHLNRRKLVLSRLGPGCGVKGTEMEVRRPLDIGLSSRSFSSRLDL